MGVRARTSSREKTPAAASEINPSVNHAATLRRLAAPRSGNSKESFGVSVTVFPRVTCRERYRPKVTSVNA